MTARRGFLLALGSSALFLWAHEADAADELVVIVNRSSKIRSVNKSDLAPVFLTKSKSLDGERIEPVNLPADSSERKAFDEAVLDMTPDEVRRYWIDRRIRGGARPPRKLANARLVVRYVAKSTGAVGYVPESAVEDGVRIVARIRGESVIAE